MKTKDRSHETRFGGPRGNSPGMTGLQRELEIKNAELATKIRARLLRAVDAVVSKASHSQALEQVEVNVLRLLKDAEDRGLGTPKASVDVTTNGKDVSGGVDLSLLSSEALAELIALRDAAAKPD